MDQGNWVAIDKRIVHSLPKIAGREYSVVEAMVSLSVDYDNKNKVTLRGLASLWKWNHKTVKRWLSEIGVKISYPGDPRLGGFIEFEEGTLKERKGNTEGTLRMIKNKEIVYKEERKGNTEGTLKEPTIYPDPKPDPKKKETPGKSFPDDSIEMKISKYFFSVLLRSDPNNKKPNFQKWCKEVDYILRLDNRSTEDIKKVINYAHNPANSNDDFSWIPNLRSPKKLRDKFTTILLQCSGIQNQDDGSSAAEARKKRTQEFLK